MKKSYRLSFILVAGGLLSLFTNISCAQISADSAFKIIKKQVLFDDL